jgi:hypothetical protein
MEKNLLEDKSGLYRKELINKLLQYGSEVNILIHNANDDNDVFNRLNMVKRALQQAQYTIEKF